MTQITLLRRKIFQAHLHSKYLKTFTLVKCPDGVFIKARTKDKEEFALQKTDGKPYYWTNLQFSGQYLHQQGINEMTVEFVNETPEFTTPAGAAANV